MRSFLLKQDQRCIALGLPVRGGEVSALTAPGSGTGQFLSVSPVDRGSQTFSSLSHSEGPFVPSHLNCMDMNIKQIEIK
jgi:hypothetical protein